MQAGTVSREQQKMRDQLLKDDPSLVGMYDDYVKGGGNPSSFRNMLQNANTRGALSTLASLGNDSDALLNSGVASQDIWSHTVGGAEGDGYSVNINGSDTRVTDSESYGLKTLNALSDLQSGISELNKTVPLDDLMLAVQVAAMGPAAFALDYAKGQLIDSVAGEYIQAGFEKFATVLNAGAHNTDVGTASYLLGNRTQFEDRQWNSLDAAGTDTKTLTDAEHLLSLNQDFGRSQGGAKILAAGLLFGTAAVKAGMTSGRSTSVDAGIHPGEFSIADWSGYPAGVPKPQGPFRLLEGAEYNAARDAADSANRAIRRQQGLGGQPVDIHEIKPVKFGGSPTDPANKIVLSRDTHRQQVTPWWKQLQRDLSN